MKKEVKEILCGWVMGLFVCFLITMCTGCTTNRYVTQPEIHNNYVNRTDTIQKSDTIIKEKTTLIQEVDSATLAQFGIQLDNQRKAFLVQINNLEKQMSKFKEVKTDTVIERDSIPYPVEVTKEVPRDLNWFQETLMGVCGMTIVAIFLIVAARFFPRKQ